MCDSLCVHPAPPRSVQGPPALPSGLQSGPARAQRLLRPRQLPQPQRQPCWSCQPSCCRCCCSCCCPCRQGQLLPGPPHKQCQAIQTLQECQSRHDKKPERQAAATTAAAVTMAATDEMDCNSRNHCPLSDSRGFGPLVRSKEEEPTMQWLQPCPCRTCA